MVELRAARRRASRRALRLRAEMRRAGALYEPEQLHMVRVAAKKLRYALEVDRELSRSRAMARIDRIKQLQDALGQIHDFEILLEHTREVRAKMAGTEGQASTELDALVHTLETECRDGHAAYVRDRPAIDTICAHVVEAARSGGPTFK
jgi:CHAD domain-containing protein